MKGTYQPTIGLEIHAELRTKTKMFCGCKNDPKEERANVNICAICTAQPGTLPVINEEAIKHMVRIGTAVGGTIADFSEFDRKNYFYPDIPKGYQISQYKYPIVSGGFIGGVALTRIHLEEDTASSTHDKGDTTLINYNRSGVPLMELVTEPVIHSAEDAVRFAKELQLLLRTLGASDANMEEGQMRVEANISISMTEKFGTKVEVKNINSFKAVEGAIRYELKRHQEVLEEGGVIIQETRGWNEDTQSTFSQRKKENAHDYRYFPEPDLPKLKLSEVAEFAPKKVKALLPELPWEKRTRLLSLGLTEDTTEFFVADQMFGPFLDTVCAPFKGDKELIKLASNYIASDFAGLVKSDSVLGLGKVTPEAFASLMMMVKSGDISSRGAKDLLPLLRANGGDPKAIAKAKGLIQKSDPEALKKLVGDIVAANPKVVDEYRAGKQASLQFLVGQGMRASKGSANPQVLAELFQKALQ
jgi:aspartyl-tRNA(Asn)/glutamyl-tRNA(Gln) amidotransferase subunit B